jgi:hypothetical protein
MNIIRPPIITHCPICKNELTVGYSNYVNCRFAWRDSHSNNSHLFVAQTDYFKIAIGGFEISSFRSHNTFYIVKSSFGKITLMAEGLPFISFDDCVDQLKRYKSLEAFS